MANPARGLLNRENKTKTKSLAAYPYPTPDTARSEEKKTINYAMHLQVRECISSINCSVVLVLVSRIQRVLVANTKKLLYTVSNPARGLLNREKKTKTKSLAAYPYPTPDTARSEKKKTKNHAMHLQVLRRSRSVSRLYMDIFGSSTRPMGVASQNSTLPSAITSFPVSLLLSSPGDV